MPIEITMPKLTDTMTEATLAKWLKKEGDAVKPGDMIAEVETDKAVQELETFEAGTVARILIPEGGKTPVGALIVVLAKPGEDPKQIAAGVKGAPSSAAPSAPKSAPAAPPAAPSSAPSPVAASADVPVPAAPSEPIAVEDHEEGSESKVLPTGRIRVSPLARKMAEDKNIEL